MLGETDFPLIEQIRHALSKDFYPLSVSEESNDETHQCIRHNDYLAHACQRLCGMSGARFICGYSLADNDAHDP